MCYLQLENESESTVVMENFGASRIAFYYRLIGKITWSAISKDMFRITSNISQRFLVHNPPISPNFIKIHPQRFELSCLQTDKHSNGGKTEPPPKVAEVIKENEI